MDTLLTLSRRRLLRTGAALGTLAAAGTTGSLASLALLGGCSDSPTGPQRLVGQSMGSTWTVALAGPAQPNGRLQELQVAVQEALDAVDDRMSLYKPGSELVRLNQAPAGHPTTLSTPLLQVLQAGQAVARLTEGAFDMTVAPLVMAWGFGPGPDDQVAASPAVPPPERLRAGRELLGHQRLVLDAAEGTAIKHQAAVQLDLGGIAKGYGVDRAADALAARGIQHFMVEVGGEVRTAGLNAQGRAWQIGIEQPDALPRRARSVLPLSGLAMATSGDYRIYFEQDGRRYSHEIDPLTGEPVQHALASVTVVADTCLMADALATGLIVMGLERGLALARQQGLAVHFIERNAAGGLRDHSSPAYARLASAVQAA